MELILINIMDEQLTLVVVICTRNRPGRLLSVVGDVLDQTRPPKWLIVVDSSDEPADLKVLQPDAATRISHIPSSPGLPHQRNKGIKLLKNTSSDTNRIVLFLDDDLSVPKTYCQNLLELFTKNPQHIGIGGFDLNLKLRPSTFLERLVHLREKNDFGTLLRSAVAVPPFPKKDLESTEWFAGHSMAFREELFSLEIFNESIRMYGEDIDFLLRAGNHGLLATSSRLGVYHNPENAGRDDLKVSESYNHGFRWSLAQTYPNRFSKVLVFFSTIFLLVYYAGTAVKNCDSKLWARANGITLFLCRLILRREVVQPWPSADARA